MGPLYINSSVASINKVVKGLRNWSDRNGECLSYVKRFILLARVLGFSESEYKAIRDSLLLHRKKEEKSNIPPRDPHWNRGGGYGLSTTGVQLPVLPMFLLALPRHKIWGLGIIRRFQLYAKSIETKSLNCNFFLLLVNFVLNRIYYYTLYLLCI